IDVIVLDSEWDGEKALNNLEDLIIQGVDHISVFVYTPEQAQDFIDRANEAGIPISFENTKLVGNVTGDYVVNVAFEYYEFGYEAAKYISETWPGAKLFYVRGLPGMGIVEEYMRGINDALEEFGTVEMTVMRDTNWDTETALNATQDVIAAGEEFDVIFANNESMRNTDRLHRRGTDGSSDAERRHYTGNHRRAGFPAGTLPVQSHVSLRN
ncbi:MAG: sugar ABC transporter substrate-binding protein, partial [Spirochaetota bacterium]